MNALFSLWTLFPFLDQVVTPPSATPPDSSLSTLLVIILILFLAFIGYLIWCALTKKK